jgi:hypothetical protein
MIASPVQKNPWLSMLSPARTRFLGSTNTTEAEIKKRSLGHEPRACSLCFSELRTHRCLSDYSTFVVPDLGTMLVLPVPLRYSFSGLGVIERTLGKQEYRTVVVASMLILKLVLIQPSFLNFHVQ